MSERMGVTFREDLPSPVVEELDRWSARLNANQTYVNQRLDRAGLGLVNVLDFGAVGDGLTDDYAAIMSAYESLKSTDYAGTIYFPPGTYAYSKPLIFSGTDLKVWGNGAILYFTGTGVAVTFDGESLGIPYRFGAGMENIQIRGNTNATKGLRVHQSHHGRFVNITVQDVTTTGFEIENSVCNYFENLRLSGNEFAQVPNAVTGIDLRTGACSANTFINPVIEKVSGNGISINGGVRNCFKGGTSEGCGGYGVQVITGGFNSWEQLDCEANTTGDFDLSGGSQNTLINCLGSSLQTYGGVKDTGGYLNTAIGCQFHNISVTSGAKGFTLINCSYSLNGTGASAGTYSNASSDGTVFNVINAYSAAKEPCLFQRLQSTMRIYWDDGSGTADVDLYRSSANTLRTSDGFIVDGLLTTSGGIAALRPGTGYGAFQFGVAGDSQYRIALLAGGTIEWGDGTNTRDTLLYRDAANVLKTPDDFKCQELTTNGGVQTFGANDSGGAGYRLVRVPNA